MPDEPQTTAPTQWVALFYLGRDDDEPSHAIGPFANHEVARAAAVERSGRTDETWDIHEMEPVP